MRLAMVIISVALLGAVAVQADAAPPGAIPTAAADNIAGAKPLPLTGKRRAAFEAYVADALDRFNVPGAAVAVVQKGAVVYLNGFGVKELGSTRPVTPDTLMMIGSITKSMTTMLAATLVDHGQLTWDTRLDDLLPEFSLGDNDLARRLTVHDAFCNCSGVPSLNLNSYFQNASKTPEQVVKALAQVKPIADYGQQFIYNNLLIGSGGYALGVAAGGGSADLGLAYDVALRERVLGPIGMKRSTFDLEKVLDGGDYALPHAADLSGDLKPLPLMAEHGLLPFRPAGALWSNAREMARYLQTELARGVAPGGTRVVSAESLQTTWTPAVPVPNFYGGPPLMAATMTSYGLGWLNGDYRGLRVVSHSGGTGGFASEIAFLPEADLGVVILTKAISLSPIPLGFQFAVELRLFELLLDQPAEIDAQMTEQAKTIAATPPPRPLGKVDTAAARPYVGRYDNPDLGEVSLAMIGDRFVLDTGQINTELRPVTGADGPTVYLLYDPPLSLFSEVYGATVTFSAGQQPQMTIAVPASVTGPEQKFVFTPRR